MSKAIKSMEMADLRSTFQDVRDMVVLSVKGLNSLGEHTLRSSLRKKKIRLKMVKNSLTRRVFAEMGMDFPADSPVWKNNTVVVFGANSIAELSREVEAELKDLKKASLYKDKVTVKTAVAEGQLVPFDVATKMPTRAEAIGQILSAVLAPGGAIAGCLTAPGGLVAGQIASIIENAEKEVPANAPAA